MNVEFTPENFNNLVNQVNDLSSTLHTYQLIVLICFLFLLCVEIFDIVYPHINKIIQENRKNKKDKAN